MRIIILSYVYHLLGTKFTNSTSSCHKETAEKYVNKINLVDRACYINYAHKCSLLVAVTHSWYLKFETCI